VALFGVLLMAAAIPALARAYGRDPGTAFALGVLNPLVVLFLIGSGHNDALMVGLLVAGLALAARRHPVIGIVLCAMAGAVKAPGLIGVAAIAVLAWGPASARPSVLLRLGRVAWAGLLTVLTFSALGALSGLGWGWIRTLNASGQVSNWITPLDLLANGLARVGNALDLLPSGTSLLGPAHVLGLIGAVALGLYATWRVPQLGLLRAMGLALVGLVLLGPIVWPWYLVWGVALLAVAQGQRTTRALIWCSVTASLLGALGPQDVVRDLGAMGFVLDLALLLALAAAAITPIQRHVRSAPPALVAPGPDELQPLVAAGG
jgi:hypothetical protein